MQFIKAGKPVYKSADRFVNWQPVYKPVKLAFGSQHTYAVKIFLLVPASVSYSTMNNYTIT